MVLYKNILISGSLVFDRIMDYNGKFSDHILPEKIHEINLSFPIDNLQENFGGTAGNIAYNLSLLGERPLVLAAVGNDFFAYEKWLGTRKIITSEIKKIKNIKTCSAYIFTDKADNQITGFSAGAMSRPCGTIKRNFLKESLAIVSPGNLEDMAKYPEIYKKNKVKYIFDPGQQLTSLSKKEIVNGLTGAEILIGNDYEIELIKQKSGLPERKIIDKVNILITTLGEKGSLINAQGKILVIPAATVSKVADPTGAGDAYRAGFIKGILNNWSLEKTGRFASVVASFAVEEYGGQNHRFDWKKLERRYKENFGEKI